MGGQSPDGTAVKELFASQLNPARTAQSLSIADRLAGLTESSVYAVAGATAGVVSGLVVCPLDVVKTKLQAQGGFTRYGIVHDHYYDGLRGTIATIWKTEGFKGFYRGVVPITFGYLPTWMIYFTVYESCKKTFGKLWGFRDHPFTVHVASALCAGCSSTTITNPIWVVKTRLMTQNSNTSWYYKGTIDAFRTMYKKEGIMSFYAGLLPAFLGLTHVAVQFPLYEEFKHWFVPGPESELSETRKVSGIIVASSLSKMCASIATYPHEVVRTRMQIQRGLPHNGEMKYSGVLQTITSLFKEEGWRVFYSGLGTNLVRTVPASAVTLITYEVIVDEINRLKRARGFEEAPV
ncbi:mitochondrial carrier domain-containing protein [Lipomyces orientalis]|uniref:Mitochondrial carrier domain-containing protein n=1 Tax=Lipomyces orientalis TaxID=1233043 RepID=A0ACC3TZ02_9ASCO